MKSLIFSVYDGAVRAFLEPFFAPTVESAKRSFGDVCNREGHQFNRHPEDYTLYLLGEFDQETGTLTGSRHECLGVAVAFVEKAPAGIPVRYADSLQDAHGVAREVNDA